jgi:TonB family protein
MMILPSLGSKIVAAAAICGLLVTPDSVQACSFYAPVEIVSNHMRQKCYRALAEPKRFLAKVRDEKFDQWALADYVRAFDEGKYGCRKNQRFVFRMLDSYYSVDGRALAKPSLLRRYAFSWPKDKRIESHEYVYDLLWLFAEHKPDLAPRWTAERARSFIDDPRHWPIAIAQFGKGGARDDIVFASLSDQNSPHFDRDKARELASVRSKNQIERRLTTAALFIDPKFGPPDPGKAATLLPISAMYNGDTKDPRRETAHHLWKQVADAYVASNEPAKQDRGRMLKAKMAPVSENNWPHIAYPNDGRIWLSLTNWPTSIKNPFAVDRGSFASPSFTSNLISAADYPSRALRNEEVGAVTVAAVFGADGKFATLEVIQSSGTASLDEATIRIINRRFRPKLDGDLVLQGFSGKEVRVPLLRVDWRMSDETNDTDGVSHYANGTLTITATPHIYDYVDGGCGIPTSMFV